MVGAMPPQFKAKEGKVIVDQGLVAH